MSDNNLIKLKKLTKGDTIGIVSPAGALKDDVAIDRAAAFFKENGYKIKVAPHVFNKKGYLAGSDENRAKDIMEMFCDDSVNAIICARGGYGCYRILEKLDYNIIKANPKIFVGFSDITALHCAFEKFSDLPTFHGPLAAPDFGGNIINDYTSENFFSILEGDFSASRKNISDYTSIYQGEAHGRLAGGNLAVLAGLSGTPFFPDLKGKILLLEDVGEPLYKIDRMFMQLKLSGKLKGVKAILFAGFTDSNCETVEIIDLLKELTSDMEIPVGYGFPATHDSSKDTLPLGFEYYLNTKVFELRIEESLFY